MTRRTAGAWAGGLLAATALWLWLTWPLARHVTSGIPASAQNVESSALRAMLPGDHLQLLYHFELARGMLSGRIPWFQNPYEFNFGNDQERFRPGAYFLPFSAVYAVLAGPLGQAAAWNLTGLLTIWLSAIFTWFWLRRFDADPAARALGALVSLCLAFRWVSLLGGSPAGFALVWLPLLAWMTDRAVREPSVGSGAMMGLTLLLCGWTDLQVFFFAALATPALALLSLAALPGGFRNAPWRRWWRATPGLLFFGALILAYHAWRHAFLAESTMSGGRDWREVQMLSPTRRGVLFQTTLGLDGVVYLGWTVGVSLLGALALWAADVGRRKRSAGAPGLPYWLWPTALLAAGAVIWLGLGGHAPDHGRLMQLVRRVFPFYRMIRQPAKIFALLTLLLPWLVAVGWGGVAARVLSPRARRGFLLLLTLALLVESGRVVRATVCRLDDTQGAYAAVTEDARANGRAPGRALVLPLWPGDSANASVYLHYAQQYGLRLVNGYSPAVSRRYLEEVFRTLESANQGWLTETQLHRLRERGIFYLLLHEDMFPEKVSPFPVGLTRDRLRMHPALEPLAQDGPVHAFRIRAETPAVSAAVGDDRPRFPARRREFESWTDRTVDPRCSGGAYRSLAAGGTNSVWLSAAWRVAPDPALRWLIRARGRGFVRCSTLWADMPQSDPEMEIASDDWGWIAVPLPPLPDFGQIHLRVEPLRGAVDLDCGLLLRGAWETDLPIGAARVIPAEDFFHAGASDPATGAVHFQPDRDPAGAVLYGPKLPLAPGRYRLEWDIASPAPPGTELGWTNARRREGDESGRVPLRAGEPARLDWEQTDSVPVNWVLVYNRAAPLTVRGATLTRLPPEPRP